MNSDIWVSLLTRPFRSKHYWGALRKVPSAVGCPKLIKRFVDLHTFQILINCFVYSHIEYCLPVWGFQSTHHLQRIQNKLIFFSLPTFTLVVTIGLFVEIAISPLACQ